MDRMESIDPGNMGNGANLEIDPNFEPQMRARSNTWPLPRPDNYGEIKTEPGEEGAQCKNEKGLFAGGKKTSSRRNAWGNTSYAELITMAIDNSPEKRLTLSQIYDWMVQNVPYFKDKGDSNSSAGWKNSIRHNLSLHKCFVRTQNEGAGKSSWWTLDPSAKSDRRTERRRTSSMDTKKYEKRRGPLKKKVEAIRNGLKTASSPCSSISESLDAPGPGFYSMSMEFRPRASSNASSCGRLSPIPSSQSELSDDPSPSGPSTMLPSWNSDIFSRPSDRYETDQLVSSLAETMKLGNGSSTEGGSSYLGSMKSSPGGPQLSPMSYEYNSHFNGPNASSRFTTGSYGSASGGPNGSVDYGSYTNPSTPHCSPRPNNLLQTATDLQHLAPLTPTTTSYNLTTLQTVSPSHTKNLSPSTTGQEPSGANLEPVLEPLTPMRSTSAYSSSRSPIRVSQENFSAFQSNHQRQPGPSSSLHNPSMLRAALTTKDGSAPCSCCPAPETTLSVTATTSHVMGHLLAINNPMPNDLDLNFESLSSGLECDVDQVINHELSVDGNLDFNFDAAAAAAAGNPNSLALFRNGRYWVH